MNELSQLCHCNFKIVVIIALSPVFRLQEISPTNWLDIILSYRRMVQPKQKSQENWPEGIVAARESSLFQETNELMNWDGCHVYFQANFHISCGIALLLALLFVN